MDARSDNARFLSAAIEAVGSRCHTWRACAEFGSHHRRLGARGPARCFWSWWAFVGTVSGGFSVAFSLRCYRCMPSFWDVRREHSSAHRMFLQPRSSQGGSSPFVVCSAGCGCSASLLEYLWQPEGTSSSRWVPQTRERSVSCRICGDIEGRRYGSPGS